VTVSLAALKEEGWSSRKRRNGVVGRKGKRKGRR